MTFRTNYMIYMTSEIEQMSPIFFRYSQSNITFCLPTLGRHLIFRTLSTTLGYSYLSQECGLQIVAASLYQRRLRHATRTSERHTPKLFHKQLDGLSFLLFCCKESWYRYLCIVFEEASQKQLLEANPCLDRASGKLHEPFKSHPLRVPMNKRP